MIFNAFCLFCKVSFVLWKSVNNILLFIWCVFEILFSKNKYYFRVMWKSAFLFSIHAEMMFWWKVKFQYEAFSHTYRHNLLATNILAMLPKPLNQSPKIIRRFQRGRTTIRLFLFLVADIWTRKFLPDRERSNTPDEGCLFDGAPLGREHISCKPLAARWFATPVRLFLLHSFVLCEADGKASRWPVSDLPVLRYFRSNVRSLVFRSRQSVTGCHVVHWHL